MPLFDFKCPKCGKTLEMLCKNSEEVKTCPICGEKLQRSYSGTVYGATGKKTGGCSGNCSTCSGCK